MALTILKSTLVVGTCPDWGVEKFPLTVRLAIQIDFAGVLRLVCICSLSASKFIDLLRRTFELASVHVCLKVYPGFRIYLVEDLEVAAVLSLRTVLLALLSQ